MVDIKVMPPNVNEPFIPQLSEEGKEKNNHHYTVGWTGIRYLFPKPLKVISSRKQLRLLEPNERRLYEKLFYKDDLLFERHIKKYKKFGCGQNVDANLYALSLPILPQNDLKVFLEERRDFWSIKERETVGRFLSMFFSTQRKAMQFEEDLYWFYAFIFRSLNILTLLLSFGKCSFHNLANVFLYPHEQQEYDGFYDTRTIVKDTVYMPEKYLFSGNFFGRYFFRVTTLSVYHDYYLLNLNQLTPIIKPTTPDAWIEAIRKVKELKSSEMEAITD